MKKKIKTDFFSDSKKWPRRVPKIKIITYKVIKLMNKYFKKEKFFNLNLILSEKNKIRKLNKKFKNKDKDTDVLTFVTNISNKDLGKILYCDIFFSIDTIERYINNKQLTLYDHYTHLLIHSILHINGYEHNNSKEFNKMKNEEIKVLKNFGINDPYLN